MKLSIEKKQDIKDMPKRIPINGTFELTVRCNLHCKMCLFRHDDKENGEILLKELTATQWIDIAKQVAKAGTMSLLITGGEPMIRSDFCEIWEGIYKQGFIMELYTNATLVTPRILETLRKYPPHKIGITIYGAGSETYKNVCGSAEAFTQAIYGIQALQTLPSTIAFRTTIIKDNYNDVKAIEQLVKEKFHSESEITETRLVMNSVRGACTKVSSCRLEAKENIELMLHRSFEQLNEKAKKKGIELSGYDIHIKKKEKNDGYHNLNTKLTLLGCDAGMRSYTISWDGRLLICQLLEKYSSDIIKSSFEDEWKILPMRVEIPILSKKCRQCKYYDICPACPASRYAETGDMGGAADYFCKDVQELMKYINGRNNNEEKRV